MVKTHYMVAACPGAALKNAGEIYVTTYSDIRAIHGVLYVSPGRRID
jgi:hypothetical protein